jgi:hypothetical protein
MKVLTPAAILDMTLTVFHLPGIAENVELETSERSVEDVPM